MMYAEAFAAALRENGVPEAENREPKSVFE